MRLVQANEWDRRANESPEQYRERRNTLNASYKRLLRPRLRWDSERRGTYVRKTHGELA